jgi:carbonic anhydrase
LVLGHERRGAVQATLGGGEPGTHIQSLVEAISPAVIEAKKKPGEPVANAVRANVQLVVQQLRRSGPILADQIRDHRIRIVGAVYELDSGSVLLLPE